MKKIILFLLIFALSVPSAAAQNESMDNYIARAVEDGILYGDENGNLGENNLATRAEFLSILVRFLGLSGGNNDFLDVKNTDWFSSSVATAKFCGIFAGYDDGTARPMENLLTQDAVSIFGRYYNAVSTRGKYLNVSDYAEKYFAYAYENRFFDEFDNFPNPKRYITKGEIITLLYRYKEAFDKNCFADGYPQIPEKQSFNKISVEIKLNDDCEISYSLCKRGTDNYKWIKAVSCEKSNKIFVLQIDGKIDAEYDLYLKAVSKTDGRTEIKVIENIVSFAFLKGEGTKNSPYVIYSAIQLKQIGAGLDKHYILGNDIELKEEWQPIKSFKGTLNGDGHSITGLKIDSNKENLGLFSEIDGGRVLNLLVDANITGNKNVGIIAGINKGTIENVVVTGSIKANTNNCGGICGVNRGAVENSMSSLYTVASGSNAGGVSGQNYGEITNCLSATEAVFSDMYAGSMAGINIGGKISSCVAANMAVYNTMTYNSGKISTNQNGGITKNNYSYDEMTSNSVITDADEYSQNGLEVSWNELLDENFYYDIGFDKNEWGKTKNDFILIYPKKSKEPILDEGRTIYYPKMIGNEEELRDIANNPGCHFALSQSISMTLPWKTIDGAEGFSGTLDGRDFSIKNLTLKGASGFFSNITGGTVKNLNFENVYAKLNDSGSIITTCNYGYIENCKVSGKIEAKNSAYIGAVTTENNGRISKCTINVDIDNKCENSVIGGICANNQGVINANSFGGRISTSGENSVIGGVCGYDTNGYLSENYSSAHINGKSNTIYAGGISGITDGTQGYKCASNGNIFVEGENVYAGGISALSQNSSVYNSLSGENITVTGDNSYIGGIVGFLKESNLQNTYATGSLVGVGNSQIGGICGYSETSFVMQNVSLNPSLNGNGNIGAVVGGSEMSEISDNYCVQDMLINSSKVLLVDNTYKVKSIQNFKKIDFYLKPISDGGFLGWDETAWKKISGYDLPTLTNVSNMNNLIMPKYK